MTARNQLLVVLTVLMLVCSSGAMVAGATPAATVDEDTDTNESEDPEPSDETETAPDEQPDDDAVMEDDEDDAQDATVTFSDQTTDGETVVVDEVTMASGGFVVIHDSSLLVGEVIESVIGTSEYLEPGTHENVEVTLDEPLEEDETLIAMPHRDTNDNETFDFVETEGEDDGPYLTADDEPVTDRAVVTVDDPADLEEGPVEEKPVEEKPVEEEPVEEEPVEEEPVEEKPVEEEPVEEKPEEEPVEEKPVEEEPVEEEPVEEEPVEEKPVEEEPVDEEPVEEEPVEEIEDDVIDIVIEQATIFVYVGDLSDDEHAVAVDTANDDVDAASGVDDDMATENHLNDVELSFTTADLEVTVTVTELTVVVVDDKQLPDMEDESGEEAVDGLEDESADDEAVTDADDEMPAEADENGEIVIEQLTIFVLIEDVHDLFEEPTHEEPTHEEPTHEESDETTAESMIGVGAA